MQRVKIEINSTVRLRGIAQVFKSSLLVFLRKKSNKKRFQEIRRSVHIDTHRKHLIISTRFHYVSTFLYARVS